MLQPWICHLFTIRSQGMGLMAVISRLGGASATWVAQYLAHIHKYLPFNVMGGLALISAIFCLKLPETSGLPTAEAFSPVMYHYYHMDIINGCIVIIT